VADPEEVAPPVYAAGLHPDVREGFNLTCDYIKRSIKRLEHRLERKIDALADIIRARVSIDDGIGRVNIVVPPLSGQCEPEDYLVWEKRVDQIFDAYRYTEEKKVQLAGSEFTGYVFTWWDQICRTRLRPTTWHGMKELLRRRFLHNNTWRRPPPKSDGAGTSARVSTSPYSTLCGYTSTSDEEETAKEPEGDEISVQGAVDADSHPSLTPPACQGRSTC